MAALRPTPRHVFLAKDRQPLVYFYTSNLPKFLQARLVFERAGLVLQHFKSREDPYAEDYTVGKEELLLRAVQEIRNTIGSGSLFFVEDTSLRIDALSGDEDYPGLAVKEWFPTVTFDLIDRQLKEKGDNRTATVKSDIALHLPGLSRTLLFHGSTNGEIARTAPNFQEDRQYPWLTPHTFNGWLVPHGAGKRLGEMSVEESWRYDFRIQALEALLDRLEEYAAVLNLSGPAYRVRPAPVRFPQPTLFPEQSPRPVYVVVGHTCAGKTTFAEYANVTHALAFIEASSVMRMLAKETNTERDTALASAQSLLSVHGSDIVARRILDLYAEQVRAGAVISGFRTIEELEVIRDNVPNMSLVVIESTERTRFQRCLNRDRDRGPKNLTEFRAIDGEQGAFGLIRIAQDFAEFRIVNESTIEDYYRVIDALIAGAHTRETVGLSSNVNPRISSEDNQLFRCLAALSDAGRPLACDEIQARTTKRGHAVRHNNANKVLKRVPALARRLDAYGDRVRYEITNSGRAYLRYLTRHIADSVGSQNEHQTPY